MTPGSPSSPWARLPSPSSRSGPSSWAEGRSRITSPVWVALLAPALLAALVVTQVAGGNEEIVLDARLVGLGAAAAAILLRAPLLAVVVAAAASTAIVRLL